MNCLSRYIFSLFLMFAVTPAMAELFFYHAPSHYSDGSEREAATSNGAYFNSQSVEMGVEKTTLEFKDGSVITQKEMTAIWKPYADHLSSLRLGIHGISSNDMQSDGKLTLITETLHYSHDVYGAALYYTHYPNDDAEALQLSPRIGRYFWPSFLLGTSYLQLQANGIFTQQENEQNNYYSLDLKAHWKHRPWAIEVGGWLGKQRSAIADSGSTAYNLNDLYRGEARLYTTLELSKRSALKLGGRLNLRSTDNGQNHHYASTFLLGYYYTF